MNIGTRRLRTPNLQVPSLPRPRGKVGKFLKAVLPLLVIGAGTYVFFNFPALKARIDYWGYKPNAANTRLLPPSTRGGGGGGGGEIPVGTNQTCGRNIPYNNQGVPALICDNYVYIPKIKVAAPIIYTKSTNEAVINDDLLKGVVHYPSTAEPGQKGNVFLTGHSSYYAWNPSAYKTVFTLVPQLIGGDEIIIYNKGIRYTYKVNEVREVGPTEVSVLRPTENSIVTLSTCVPIGTSYRRKIIRAVQTSPDPKFNRAGSAGSATPGRLPGVR